MYDEAHILSILDNPLVPRNSQIIARMLLAMYARQTSDEQAIGSTKHDNKVGFSMVDCDFLSDVAVRSRRYGLSPKQTVSVAKCLRKYRRQLVEIAAGNIAARSEQVAA